MSETAGMRGEFLTPVAEFLYRIDAHFDAVGGRGVSGRTGEETIHLQAEDNIGLLGPNPNVVFADRPLPGNKEFVAIWWPDIHGHRVSTIASQGKNIRQSTLYFVQEDTLWVRSAAEAWSMGSSGGTRRELLGLEQTPLIRSIYDHS